MRTRIRTTISVSSVAFIAALLIIVTMVALSVSPVQALIPNNVCYVKEDAGGNNDGSSWTHAYSSWLGVFSALEDTTCTQIWVAAGTYMPGYSRTDTFQLKSGVRIYGGFAGTESSVDRRDIVANETILSGNIQVQVTASDNSYHVVTASGTDETAVLDGFTITDGYADGTSPGDKGAGIYTANGSPTLRNLTFKNNYATSGAGMYNNNSTPTISGALFISNTATSLGGGMYNGMSNVELANVTFSGNSASRGAGMYNSYSLPTLKNLTVTGNSAASHGGGIYNELASPVVENTILWGNSAATDGDQIFDDEDSTSTVRDSVVEGGFAGENIVTGDPLLGALGDYGGRMLAIPIQPESSARDVGDDLTCVIVDQRGLSRAGQGTACDIGAFEYQPVLYAVPGGRTSGFCQTWALACELRYALPQAYETQEIWVQAGSHYPTDGSDRGATFQLKSGVGVYGGFAGTETSREQRNWTANQTVLSGDIGALNDLSDNSRHVVRAVETDETAVLDGFLVKYGWGDRDVGAGAGMYIALGSPTVRNSVFALNSALRGGGMYNASDPTLENVQFIENEAVAGAGMFNHGSATPVLNNVTFRDNIAHDGDFTQLSPENNLGGGMYNTSNPMLTDVTFEGNTAADHGGGMYGGGSSEPTLLRVAFTGNSAGRSGGGMSNDGSAPELTNVTFTENRAADGGGIANWNGATPVLNDVRFRANIADTDSGWIARGGGMYNTGSSPTVISATFRTNYADDGAGVYNYQSSPQLTDVTFDGNDAAESGGGMHNAFGSAPILQNFLFTNNDATEGGGMYNRVDSAPTLTNGLFQGEEVSGYGGGIYNWDSHPTITDVTFDGNASSGGGGMYNTDGSEPVLNRVTFSGNYGNAGGGVFNESSHPQLTNVTFYDNVANEGGGLNNYLSNPTLSHVTFGNNFTYGQGGGIFNGNSAPVIDNSIFWGNTARFSGPQIANVIDSNGDPPILNNNVIEGGCPADAVCTDVITADPLLGVLGDYGGNIATMPLGAGSSALDAADDTFTDCPATDQRAVPRPQNVVCDIGAFEARSFALTVSRDGTGSGTVTGEGISCGSDCSESYVETSVVQLIATASAGSVFTGWSGACAGTGTCAVSMSEAQSVTATFATVPPGEYALTVTLAGSGSGTVTGTGINCFDGSGADCTETYTEGTQVTLTPSSEMGSIFVGWSGACTSTTGNCVVTMNTAKSVTATFNVVASLQRVLLPVVVR